MYAVEHILVLIANNLQGARIGSKACVGYQDVKNTE